MPRLPLYCNTKQNFCRVHWRRLVKNIVKKQKQLNGEKVVITDESMGVSQLSGGGARAHAGCPRKSTRIAVYVAYTMYACFCLCSVLRVGYNYNVSVDSYRHLITTKAVRQPVYIMWVFLIALCWSRSLELSLPQSLRLELL